MKTLLVASLEFALVAAGLSGCSKEDHHAVDCYTQHKTEREAKVAWCENDGARAADMDCLNAIKAQRDDLVADHGETAADTFHYTPPQLLAPPLRA